MDQSSPEQTRMRVPAPPLPLAIDHAARAFRVQQIQHLAQVDVGIELTKAYEAGRMASITENWLSGAKVGVFCGLLAGLFIGCVGGMFWVRLGWSTLQ